MSGDVTAMASASDQPTHIAPAGNTQDKPAPSMSFARMRDVAIRVVKALATSDSTSDGRGVAYAEVVVTMPASMGADLAPADVEPAMADVVSGIEDAGAARGKAVLLLNPAEIAPRVSVLTLMTDDSDGEATRDVSARGVNEAGDALGTAIEQALANSGFVLLQPIQAQTIDVDAARTLLPDALPSGVDNLQRIDVLLQAEVAR